MQFCTFHAISIKNSFLVIWPNALPYEISVGFWPLYIIFSKSFFANCTSTPSPCSMHGVAKHQLCVVLLISYNSYEKKDIFCKYTPHNIHEDEILLRYWFSVQIWTFHLIISKNVLEKTPHLTPTCEGWRIRKHWFSKQIWKYHEISNNFLVYCLLHKHLLLNQRYHLHLKIIANDTT